MKRLLLAILTFLIFSVASNAAHIKGGFFTYRYLGPGSTAGMLRYQVTLTVYMLCNPSTGQLSNPINFSIFNAGNNQFVQDVSVNITNQYNLGKVQDEVCISGNEIGCYYTIVIYDLASIELPSTPGGYIFSYQRCCRINGINNIVNSGAVGNTFWINIPGTTVYPGAETNSSPQFPINDTAVVCHNSYFQYSFQATDPNSGDSLAYSFCDAYLGADQGNPAPATAINPPYTVVPYQSPYSGSQPMGPGVTINPITGLISGIAPAGLGEYVICVCVEEYRDGVLIGITRKELHVQVKDCEPLNALLNPIPTTCDGFNVTFTNGTSNPPGTVYHWTFGDPASGSLDTSFLEFPPPHDYTASGAGIYYARLRVSLAGGLCIDSADLEVRVFPGFFPGFRATGACYLNPFQFTDTTQTNYGVVDTWSWNFGDLTTLADTSHLQHPQWTYSTPGPKTVTLTVTNSMGCINTIQTVIDALDKPLITLGFRDTLICVPDAVTLEAGGTGVFNWTPPINIVNANTATPTVNPTTNTWYFVNLVDNGCQNRDSVLVRVVPNVSLLVRADTTICLGDPVQLNAATDGLAFQWTPAATLNDPTIVNPVATPVAPLTLYQLTATIGSCSATDDVIVRTVPYPVANAGPNQVICYNTSAQLNASHDGNSFSWSPTSYLNNPNILNPVSTPPRTTSYVLTVFDNAGCPKPGRDTVVVAVNPKVIAFAGHDTTVIVGQPMHLFATGGVSYVWSPTTGFITSNTIQNPIAVYGTNIDSVRYKVVVTDNIGCPDSAFVTVRVFKTNPSVFVPTAFTPNGDGLNDVVRPIAVGMRRIIYFSIYNRWGELVFTTTENKRGWDGRINGYLQSSNVFVWMVSAEDYLGKHYFQKGTVTLIR
ncbi:MAG: T9SS type B sorting domain-containing protein [Chitinophagaceae bacterium]|nr:T9SS type B sorting domain-containing protein [Chitinophagaceae bacterium]